MQPDNSPVKKWRKGLTLPTIHIHNFSKVGQNTLWSLLFPCTILSAWTLWTRVFPDLVHWSQHMNWRYSSYQYYETFHIHAQVISPYFNIMLLSNKKSNLSVANLCSRKNHGYMSRACEGSRILSLLPIHADSQPVDECHWKIHLPWKHQSLLLQLSMEIKQNDSSPEDSLCNLYIHKKSGYCKGDNVAARSNQMDAQMPWSDAPAAASEQHPPPMPSPLPKLEYAAEQDFCKRWSGEFYIHQSTRFHKAKHFYQWKSKTRHLSKCKTLLEFAECIFSWTPRHKPFGQESLGHTSFKE